MNILNNNEYVVTQQGYIGKVIDYLRTTETYMFDSTIQIIDNEEFECISKHELDSIILKHSNDLVELIKPGYCVNGYVVDEIRINCFDTILFLDDYKQEIHPYEIRTVCTGKDTTEEYIVKE